MILGFTGTRQGLTDKQHLRLYEEIKRVAAIAKEAHHGCAIGADDEFAQLAGTCLEPGRIIIGHPCDKADQTAQRAIRASNALRDIKPPLDRNHDIVDASTVLLACPAGMAEEQRSGTWATIRYARKQGKPVVIFWPDGTVTRERC